MHPATFLCLKCQKGFDVSMFAVLKPLNGSTQNANIFIWSLPSNSITAFEVGMVGYHHMGLVVSISLRNEVACDKTQGLGFY